MSRVVEHSSDPWLFGEDEKGHWTGDAKSSNAAVPPRAAGGVPEGSPYLESNRNIVEGPAQGVWPLYGAVDKREYLEVKACGCQSRFCPHCCTHLALKLRDKLIPVLNTFSSLLMLTLTVDPKLFDKPEDAYWHCKERRAISELVRALRKAGYLKSGRYFYVVEWHKNGWAHFHLLVESSYIPFKVLAKLWGRNRPATAPRWEGSYDGSMAGMSPEFGTVRISKNDFQSPSHAAHYALKYMMKLPEQGFPDWVLDTRGRQIRMFQTSQGLLNPLGAKQAATEQTAIEQAAVIAEQAVEANEDQAPPDDCPFDDEPGDGKSTIRERLAKCGQTAVVMKVIEYIDHNGRVVRTMWEFARALAVPFDRVQELLDGGAAGITVWQGLELYEGGE